MNLFRVRGIQLQVHFTFFLFLALFAYEGWQDGGRWVGVGWSVAMLGAFFTCVVLHELGHCFTAMRFGIGVRRILLSPIGGMAEFDGIPREPGRELLITLAGPAVNFALAAIFYLLVGWPADWMDDASYPATLEGFARLLLVWNISMGLFNFLPVFPMDGGRIFRALLAFRLPYVRATFIAATVGKILAVIGILYVALAAPLHLAAQPPYLLAVLFAFIFIVGELEYRMVRRLELEDAYLRKSFAYLYPAHPPEEPPLPSREG